MKILHLPIKKKWFDMIAAGIKKEEYRELSIHWCRRFANDGGAVFNPCNIRQFDVVRFVNGYGKMRPFIMVKCLAIKVGTGKKEWGAAPEKEYLVISLGNIIQGEKARQ